MEGAISAAQRKRRRQCSPVFACFAWRCRAGPVDRLRQCRQPAARAQQHRKREVAIRQALGAKPGRLTLQLLTESLALAVLGGTTGLIILFFFHQAIPVATRP